ncbi:hypothetical protein KC336_g15009 [Hortaea werneckii]|nr:hypothetical protein KC336_g15009 [Hortaea werneckii]
MPTPNRDGSMLELFDAIKSLSAPLATSHGGYAPERFSGLDRVAANLDGTMRRLRQRSETAIAEDMATAQDTAVKNAELNSQIEHLHRAQRATKDTALQERDIELTEKKDELVETSDALAAASQQLQEMTDKCESHKQQLRKRPATPLSSNRTRAEPHSPSATTCHMPDDDLDYGQEYEQDQQDEQSEENQQHEQQET